jgi:hypothetical protein
VTRKATSKKPTAKKPVPKAAKAKPAKRVSARAKTPGKPPAKTARAPKSKRLKVYTVVRKVYSVDGGTQYTPPEQIFATAELAQRHADALNRELVVLGLPFEHYNAGALIKGGDTALTALVEKMGLVPTTKVGGLVGRGLDWASWWNENYFNMTDDQRNILCRALDRFAWYEVRSTTLE